MKNKTFIIIMAVIVIVVLFLLLVAILWINNGKLNLFKKNSGNQANVASQEDVAYALIQLKDAKTELIKLKELAQDQESLAKIDQLIDKVNYYSAEFSAGGGSALGGKKPLKEINKLIVNEFYNSNFWQDIVELKNKINTGD